MKLVSLRKLISISYFPAPEKKEIVRISLQLVDIIPNTAFIMKVTNIALAGAAMGLSTASPVTKRAISDGTFFELNFHITFD